MTQHLVVAIKGIGLEVNVDKTKYMLMSRGENEDRRYRVKNDNNTFERAG
jgi:hypothetical protein